MRFVSHQIAIVAIISLMGCGGGSKPEVAEVEVFKDRDVQKLVQKDTSEMTVAELVTVYRVPGADDYAGPELAKRGDPAKRELVSLLKNAKTSAVDRASILQILHFYFDPSDVQDEIDRFVKNISDPVERKEVENTVLLLRQARRAAK
jgi:hypothetical protein